MKKITILFTICLSLITITNAQNNLKENLAKHIHYLSSDQMRGRELNTKEIDKAADYIKQQLKNIGLEVIDYTTNSDSLIKYMDESTYYVDAIEENTDKNSSYSKYDSIEIKNEGNKDIKNITYKHFYSIIPSTNPNKSNKYTLLYSEYSGQGVDTIKGFEIIKNSANKGASGCAALIELAKYFKENQSKLKKNIIIMFVADNSVYESPVYFAKKSDKDSVEMIFRFDDLGNIDPNNTEDPYNYNISHTITNASKILQPILLKYPNLATYPDYDTYFDFPKISIYGPYIDSYDDVADSLNYESMEQIVNQIKEVVLAFNNADLEIKKIDKQEDYYNKDNIDFLNEIISKKGLTYFGLNLMVGSNKHYYTKGNMTGKAAMSYSAGLFFKWQFSYLFSLKLDANYEFAYANRHDGRFKSNVLSIPLSFQFSIGNKYFETDLGVGAYFDYNISAKLNGENVDWDKFNRGEFGWQWSFGFRFGNFLIGYYQKIGISDIMTDKYIHNGKIKNRNKYFTIGWKF